MARPKVHLTIEAKKRAKAEAKKRWRDKKRAKREAEAKVLKRWFRDFWNFEMDT